MKVLLYEVQYLSTSVPNISRTSNMWPWICRWSAVSIFAYFYKSLDLLYCFLCLLQWPSCSFPGIISASTMKWIHICRKSSEGRTTESTLTMADDRSREIETAYTARSASTSSEYAPATPGNTAESDLASSILDIVRAYWIAAAFLFNRSMSCMSLYNPWQWN